MAETLGSLIDKLSIKNIREYHLKEALKKKKNDSLKNKLKILLKQKRCLLEEIDEFIREGIKGKRILRDEKLKLYNPPEFVGKIGKIDSLAKAISSLTMKNLELWHLEDEARRQDVSLVYIGRIKRKIDRANQQRNDLIDKVDELFAKMVKQRKSRRGSTL